MKNAILITIASSALVAAPLALGGDAADNYAHYCASCHGKDGAGHTKAGRLLKVRDLTDAQVQKSFTDEAAVKDLTDGLTDKDGNVQMKPVKGKLTDDEIKAVVAYVRTLAK